MTREQAFKQFVLREWADYVTEYLAQRIQQRGLVVTGALINSLSYELIEGDEPQLRFSFADYGRFLDIRGSQLKSGFQARMRKTSALNRAAWGISKRRDTRWYAKGLWSRLPILIDRLSWEYGEFVKNNIREAIGGGSV
jgi:hypothetical protein